MTRHRPTRPVWLDPAATTPVFPDVEQALREPDGLLAVGGNLSETWLLTAYRQGIFPWYEPGQPILWWSPDPRWVLFPTDLHISRSLARIIKKGHFSVTLDQAFTAVIRACAAPRPGQSGTWITPEMETAYRGLHHKGIAHSVECWCEGELAGGLYGIALGNIFFGESMFTRVSDASKIAFTALVRQLARWNFHLIDCQVMTAHLTSLGASAMSRQRFSATIKQQCIQPGHPTPWQLDKNILELPT